MRKRLLIMLAALLLGGCAAIPGFRSSGHLEAALAALDAGSEEEARRELRRSAEAGEAAADEALFRLALLHLREDDGSALQTLERLKRDFPESRWARQSAPLSESLAEGRRLARAKASLSRENRELRETLERLKNLELQLEQKQRR